MRHNGFVAFILTHGRPDRVLTYEKRANTGTRGKYSIVCDDEDKTLPEYRKRFGDVLVFSKSEIAKTFDEGDNFGDRRQSSTPATPVSSWPSRSGRHISSNWTTTTRISNSGSTTSYAGTAQTSKTSTRYSTCCSTISIPLQC